MISVCTVLQMEIFQSELNYFVTYIRQLVSHFIIDIVVKDPFIVQFFIIS